MKSTLETENKSFVSFMFLLSILLSIAALIYRKPEAFTKPQFWAEDGFVFFQQYFHVGKKTLFTPYAGYLHMIPRIFTMVIFKVVSFEHMPLAYNISSLLVFLALVFYIWYRTAFDLYSKFFLIIALTLLPVGDEMALTLTNLQWYSNLFIPLIFLCGYSKKFQVLDGIIIFFTALTGPYCILYLPVVAAIVWYRSRKMGQWKNERWLFMVYLLATVIQLLVLKFSTPRYDASFSLAEKISKSPTLLYRHLTNPLGIDELYKSPINITLTTVLLVALAGWILLCLRKFVKEKNIMPFFLMMLALLDAAANVYAIMPSDIEGLTPPAAGARYFYIPCLLLLWSIIMYSAKSGEEVNNSAIDTPKTSRRNFAFLLLFGYYTTLFPKTPSYQYLDFKWPENAKKIESLQDGQQLEVPINPYPWHLSLTQ